MHTTRAILQRKKTSILWRPLSAGHLGRPPSFRYSEKLQVLAEVLFVHRPRARDKADLFYLPALALYHRVYDTPEGCVLVLGCTLSPNKVPIADVGHPL
jgi:hypothetical protein